MKKLREIFETKVKILGEKKTKDGQTMSILAPWIVANVKNRNGRLYPFNLLQREVASFQDRVKKGSVIGSADHPVGAFTTLADASHIIRKLQIDEHGKGWMEAEILPTTKGRNIMTILKAGGQLGISARGAGTVSQKGRVESDYRLLGIDIVTNPSEPTAVFDKSNIFESLDFEGEKKGGEMKNKMCGLSENYVQEMMQDVYDIYIAEKTFTGSLEDFKKENERFVLAAILLEEKKFENIEEALEHLDKFEDSKNQIDILDKKAYLGATEMGFHGTQEEFEALLGRSTEDKTKVQKLTEEEISERTHGYYLEARAGGFLGTFAEWKEKFPKIVEMAKEVKIVAEKKENKRPINNKISLREAQASGFKGTADDFKEQHPNMKLILPEPPQKIKKVAERELSEKEITEEAGRIFTRLSQDNPNSALTLGDVKKLLMKEEDEKIDRRIKRKAIMIVSREADGSVSHEKLKEMVQIEIENLKKERQKRREANWKCFERLLD